MATDTTQIRVGVTGRLLNAPVGTTDPADAGAAWPAGWVDLGFLTDDGPSMKPGRTVKDITAWQSIYPVRKVVAAVTLEWTFKLMQKSGTSLKLSFGGGTVTDLGSGQGKYQPPDPSTIDERAFGLEVTDGTIVDRWILHRGLVTDLAEIPIQKDAATVWALTVGAIRPTSGDVWFHLSNDPATLS